MSSQRRATPRSCAQAPRCSATSMRSSGRVTATGARSCFRRSRRSWSRAELRELDGTAGAVGQEPGEFGRFGLDVVAFFPGQLAEWLHAQAGPITIGERAPTCSREPVDEDESPADLRPGPRLRRAAQRRSRRRQEARTRRSRAAVRDGQVRSRSPHTSAQACLATVSVRAPARGVLILSLSLIRPVFPV